MTRMPLGLSRSELLPTAAAVLAIARFLLVSLLSAVADSLRAAPPLQPFLSFLREYVGPVAIVASLALALLATRPLPSAPVHPAADIPFPLPSQTGFEATSAPETPRVFSASAPQLPAAKPAQSDRGIGQGDSSARPGEQPNAIKERAKAPFIYRIAGGDTIGDIAEKFGISMDTVVSANDITDPDALQIGTELIILNTDGAVHTVATGDTLVDIAALYGVSPDSIASYNGILDPGSLQLGAKLVVPGGKIQLARASVSSRGGARPGSASGSLRWPTTGGISSYFGGGHRGIDIMSSMGVPIYAADGGTVVTATRGTYDYGDYLVIDHGNGLRTLYAHLSAFYVDYSEKVAKGDRIGAVGVTGISTGPHLHFEVWENGAKVNPMNYLP